ncbi:MAG TPA: CRISPR-associated endonuclease Cas3'', partial [Gemmatales bacterium]|nr:CRISPR-associated endonuclease Cas3'' [Gemmatales bacterium]
IADEWEDQAGKRLRCRINEGEPVPDEMRLVQRIDTHSDEPGEDESDAAKGQVWLWFVKRNEGGSTARKPVLWDVHVRDVEQEATRILDGLKDLPSELRRVVEVAARFHDHGKRRKLFQNMLGNRNSATCWAKSGKNRSQLQEPYRHEFASLLDVVKESEFKLLSEDQKDLVLHLIAAHHGRARPHFPAVEVFDPEGTDREAEDVAAETPRRFARLQRKFGRWGLAYLESILRAADWAASAKPSAYVEGDE